MGLLDSWLAAEALTQADMRDREREEVEEAKHEYRCPDCGYFTIFDEFSLNPEAKYCPFCGREL